jgi:hypothetical protein
LVATAALAGGEPPGRGEAGINGFNGEFDSGSERTLAAWIRHASRTGPFFGQQCLGGGPVANGCVTRDYTCRKVGDSSPKGELIPHVAARPKPRGAFRGGRGLSAGWGGNGLPRRRRVAGLRGRPATLELRHGPDTYGWQQSRIFLNGGNPEGATPRGG